MEMQYYILCDTVGGDCIEMLPYNCMYCVCEKRISLYPLCVCLFVCVCVCVSALCACVCTSMCVYVHIASCHTHTTHLVLVYTKVLVADSQHLSQCSSFILSKTHRLLCDNKRTLCGMFSK